MPILMGSAACAAAGKAMTSAIPSAAHRRDMAMDESSLKFFVVGFGANRKSGGNIDFTLPYVKPYYEIGENGPLSGFPARSRGALHPAAQTKMAPLRGP